MTRLRIQRVNRVPPIPTTIIVIPNVQLSISRYLLDNQSKNIILISPQKGIFNKKSDFFNKVSRGFIPLNINTLGYNVLPCLELFGLVHEGFEAG